MKFKSPVFSQVSGSIAGITFSHNRGGLYTRSRTIPVNPGSASQIAVRANFSGLVSTWINVLTTVQRTAWALYALNTPLVDRLGDALILTGQQMYVRCNSARLRGGLARVDVGPTVFGEALLSGIAVPSLLSPTLLNVPYDNTNPWATAIDGGMIVQVGTPENPTINFFKGPYRFADTELGDPVPPTSPFVVVTPFTFTNGQAFFLRIRSSEADGRISAAQFFRGIVI